MGDPNSIATMEVGGVIQKLYRGFDWLRRESNNASGAASLIAGQSDVSKTATGASYMAGQANIRLNDTKGRVQKFTADVLSHAAWYHDNHRRSGRRSITKLPRARARSTWCTTRPRRRASSGSFISRASPCRKA